MQLVDPARLTLFPPARWEGRTAVVEIGTLTATTGGRMADGDYDRLEHMLRGIVVRRMHVSRVRPGPA